MHTVLQLESGIAFDKSIDKCLSDGTSETIEDDVTKLVGENFITDMLLISSKKIKSKALEDKLHSTLVEKLEAATVEEVFSAALVAEFLTAGKSTKTTETQDVINKRVQQCIEGLSDDEVKKLDLTKVPECAHVYATQRKTECAVGLPILEVNFLAALIEIDKPDKSKLYDEKTATKLLTDVLAQVPVSALRLIPTFESNLLTRCLKPLLTKKLQNVEPSELFAIILPHEVASAKIIFPNGCVFAEGFECSVPSTAANNAIIRQWKKCITELPLEETSELLKEPSKISSPEVLARLHQRSVYCTIEEKGQQLVARCTEFKNLHDKAEELDAKRKVIDNFSHALGSTSVQCMAFVDMKTIPPALYDTFKQVFTKKVADGKFSDLNEAVLITEYNNANATPDERPTSSLSDILNAKILPHYAGKNRLEISTDTAADALALPKSMRGFISSDMLTFPVVSGWLKKEEERTFISGWLELEQEFFERIDSAAVPSEKLQEELDTKLQELVGAFSQEGNTLLEILIHTPQCDTAGSFKTAVLKIISQNPNIQRHSDLLYLDVSSVRPVLFPNGEIRQTPNESFATAIQQMQSKHIASLSLSEIDVLWLKPNLPEFVRATLYSTKLDFRIENAKHSSVMTELDEFNAMKTDDLNFSSKQDLLLDHLKRITLTELVVIACTKTIPETLKTACENILSDNRLSESSDIMDISLTYDRVCSKSTPDWVAKCIDKPLIKYVESLPHGFVRRSAFNNISESAVHMMKRIQKEELLSFPEEVGKNLTMNAIRNVGKANGISAKQFAEALHYTNPISLFLIKDKQSCGVAAYPIIGLHLIHVLKTTDIKFILSLSDSTHIQNPEWISLINDALAQRITFNQKDMFTVLQHCPTKSLHSSVEQVTHGHIKALTLDHMKSLCLSMDKMKNASNLEFTPVVTYIQSNKLDLALLKSLEKECKSEFMLALVRSKIAENRKQHVQTVSTTEERFESSTDATEATKRMQRLALHKKRPQGIIRSTPVKQLAIEQSPVLKQQQNVTQADSKQNAHATAQQTAHATAQQPTTSATLATLGQPKPPVAKPRSTAPALGQPKPPVAKPRSRTAPATAQQTAAAAPATAQQTAATAPATAQQTAAQEELHATAQQTAAAAPATAQQTAAAAPATAQQTAAAAPAPAQQTTSSGSGFELTDGAQDTTETKQMVIDETHTAHQPITVKAGEGDIAPDDSTKFKQAVHDINKELMKNPDEITGSKLKASMGELLSNDINLMLFLNMTANEFGCDDQKGIAPLILECVRMTFNKALPLNETLSIAENSVFYPMFKDDVISKLPKEQGEERVKALLQYDDSQLSPGAAEVYTLELTECLVRQPLQILLAMPEPTTESRYEAMSSALSQIVVTGKVHRETTHLLEHFNTKLCGSHLAELTLTYQRNELLLARIELQLELATSSLQELELATSSLQELELEPSEELVNLRTEIDSLQRKKSAICEEQRSITEPIMDDYAKYRTYISVDGKTPYEVAAYESKKSVSEKRTEELTARADISHEHVKAIVHGGPFTELENAILDIEKKVPEEQESEELFAEKIKRLTNAIIKVQQQEECLKEIAILVSSRDHVDELSKKDTQDDRDKLAATSSVNKELSDLYYQVKQIEQEISTGTGTKTETENMTTDILRPAAALLLSMQVYIDIINKNALRAQNPLKQLMQLGHSPARGFKVSSDAPSRHLLREKLTFIGVGIHASFEDLLTQVRGIGDSVSNSIGKLRSKSKVFDKACSASSHAVSTLGKFLSVTRDFCAGKASATATKLDAARNAVDKALAVFQDAALVRLYSLHDKVTGKLGALKNDTKHLS